jgi:hypothetical protein
LGLPVPLQPLVQQFQSQRSHFLIWPRGGQGIVPFTGSDPNFLSVRKDDTQDIPELVGGRVYNFYGRPSGPNSRSLKLDEANKILQDTSLGDAAPAVGDLNQDGIADFSE